MFTKIEIENIGPISTAIMLDFTINKRDKSNSSSYVELPGNVFVSKIAGIIAGNSSGKTTILDTLNKIGSFIDLPNKKRNLNDYYNSDVDGIDDEIKQFLYNDIKRNLSTNKLPSLNKGIENPIGCIKLELYINNNDEYSGFYNYCLKYDNNFLKSGLIEESLFFREKYNSKKRKVIFNISGNTESEIGYKLAYKNNILEEIKFNEKEKNRFIKKINYYDTFARRYLIESSTLDAENYIFPEEFIIEMVKNKEDIVTAFAKIADKYIEKVVLDDSNSKKLKLFFDYGNYRIRYDYVSTATKKICAIASNFVKSNNKGGIFLIDELDNSLNREIIKFILNLYIKNSTENTSQLIFTTYTPEILNVLRRDQIFILTKKENNIVLTKFIDYIDDKTGKRVRKDYSFSKAYRNNIIKNFPDDTTFDLVNKLIAKSNIQ